MTEKYKNSLLSDASKLDAFSDSLGEITSYARKVTEEDDDSAVLWLLSKINTIATSEDKKAKLICSHLYESLLQFLGNQKISQLTESDKADQNNEKTLDELQDELNSCVGLKAVKQKINDLIAFHQIQMLREKANLKSAKNTLHMAFIGNPGTGKTTVARIVGQMYKKIGLLSKGHFIEASRTDLIAGYQGQTAIKVKKIIEKAKGGVLFIDEAYSITENSNSDSYGRECLTELTKALEDYREDLAVIVAGYKEPMEQFFNSNPGLKSRFNTFIYFEDYNGNELLDILQKLCAESDYKISKLLLEKLKSFFEDQVQNKTKEFSNGRMVRNIFDELIMNHAKRLISKKHPTVEELKLLDECDFA